MQEFLTHITLAKISNILFYIIAFISFIFMVVIKMLDIFEDAIKMTHLPRLNGGLIKFFKDIFDVVHHWLFVLAFLFLYSLRWFLTLLIVMLPLAIVIECIKWPTLILILLVIGIIMFIIESIDNDTISDFAFLYFLYKIFNKDEK